MFLTASLVVVPPRFFLIPDAAGLATFAVAGTLLPLVLGTPWLVASFMGVMTGTMGSIFRDILSNTHPIVFQSPLYVTASWGGSLLFIGLVNFNLDATMSAIIAGSLIFFARLLAIRYDICLPKFHFKT